MIWIRFCSQYNSASLAAHFPPLQVMKLASNSQALDNIISLHMGRRRQPAVERTKNEQRITSLYITTACVQCSRKGRAMAGRLRLSTRSNLLDLKTKNIGQTIIYLNLIRFPPCSHGTGGKKPYYDLDKVQASKFTTSRAERERP